MTIFGSARLGENHPDYQKTRELSAAITKLGVTIMTGGGPGIMDHDYHEYLMKYIDHMIEAGTVSPEDKKLFLYTDSIPMAVEHLRANTIDHFQLTHEQAQQWRPWRWLLEG